jgi:hypothetical protein
MVVEVLECSQVRFASVMQIRPFAPCVMFCCSTACQLRGNLSKEDLLNAAKALVPQQCAARRAQASLLESTGLIVAGNML